MSMRAPFAFALGVLLAASACAGPAKPPTVDPREFRGRPVSEAIEVPIEVDGDRVAVVWLASGGAFKTRLTPGREVLHVRLVIRNLDPAPLRVPLDLVCLEGVEGQERIRPLALVGHEANHASVLVPPRTTRVVDLVFPVPMTLTFEDLRSFRVMWGVDVASGIIRNETAFAVSLDDRLAGQVARSFRPVAY